VRAANLPEMRPLLDVGGNETQDFFRENGPSTRRKKEARAVPVIDRLRSEHILTEVGRPRDIQREARRQQKPLRSLHPVIPSAQPR
jgi:hypothetical protein